MKIKPSLYPVIIIAVFVLFLIIGLMLGFTPASGGHGGGDSSLPAPAIVQTIHTWGTGSVNPSGYAPSGSVNRVLGVEPSPVHGTG